MPLLPGMSIEMFKAGRGFFLGRISFVTCFCNLRSTPCGSAKLHTSAVRFQIIDTRSAGEASTKLSSSLDILCNAVACLSSFMFVYYIPCGFVLGDKNLMQGKGVCRENNDP